MLLCVQVFHSLLKAHAIEARSIVRQALEILTPVVPIRMEDANVSENKHSCVCHSLNHAINICMLIDICYIVLQATLVHWTKKIIVEEGHTVAQLVHML